MKFKCIPPDRPLLEGGDSIVEMDKAVEEEEYREEIGSVRDSDENEAESVVEVAEKRMETIDKILNRLSTGSSAYDVALSIVDELLLSTGEFHTCTYTT